MKVHCSFVSEIYACVHEYSTEGKTPKIDILLQFYARGGPGQVQCVLTAVYTFYESRKR